MKFFNKVKTGLSSTVIKMRTDYDKKKRYERAAQAQIKRKADAAFYKESEKVAIKKAKARARQSGNTKKSSGLSGFLNQAGSISRQEMSSGAFGGFNQPKRKKGQKEWWDY